MKAMKDKNPLDISQQSAFSLNVCSVDNLSQFSGSFGIGSISIYVECIGSPFSKVISIEGFVRSSIDTIEVSHHFAFY